MKMLATIVAAVDHDWWILKDAGHSDICVRAAADIPDDDTRYRVLYFLFEAGVKSHIPILRWLLLREVGEGRLRDIELLIWHGVPSHVQANSDLSRLELAAPMLTPAAGQPWQSAWPPDVLTWSRSC